MNYPKRWQVLCEALCKLLPGGQIQDVSERDWHSATFAGKRLEIAMRLNGPDAKNRAAKFGRILPNEIFTLPRYFVAEIALSSLDADGVGCSIVVEALLLEE